MKICWDNLEGVHLSKNGTFRKGQHSYVYKDFCAKCGESYLTQKNNQSLFCNASCANSGRVFSIETIKKMAMVNKGKNNPFFGKTHTAATKKKISKSNSKHKGVLASNWRGGVYSRGLTTYNTHKNTLGPYEGIRKQKNTEVLEVKCAYCGKWYAPTLITVHSRINAINNLDKGENRFYCSEDCKQACPTYGQKKYPKGFKKATSREVSTYLRQMVFERDNWECQKCGKTIKQVQLHCHHINGYAQNKILANDVDNCITLCKNCHKEVHKLPGCRYVDLRCK